MTLALEERKAWDLYIAHCRCAVDYDAVEPWAWVQLQRRLTELHAQLPKRRIKVKA